MQIKRFLCMLAILVANLLAFQAPSRAFESVGYAPGIAMASNCLHQAGCDDICAGAQGTCAQMCSAMSLPEIAIVLSVTNPIARLLWVSLADQADGLLRSPDPYPPRS